MYIKLDKYKYGEPLIIAFGIDFYLWTESW